MELKERILRRAGGPDVMKVFTEFDLNKSGDISIDEFLILLKKVSEFSSVSWNCSGRRRSSTECTRLWTGTRANTWRGRSSSGSLDHESYL